MSRSEEGADSTINRRSVLQAIGAASAASLAGCSGGGGGNLGERVPSIQIEYWSDYGGFTTTQEQMAPIMRKNIENDLGVGVEVVPKDISTQLGQLANDANRDVNITFSWWVPAADRLDPQELLNNMRLDWAGAGGQSNYSNYADCEYTRRLLEQTSAKTEEERRQGIYETIAYMSKDCAIGNLCPVANIGAYRTDRVDIGGVGKGGIARSNAEWAFKSELTQGDEMVVAINPIATQTSNWLTHSASMPEAMWQHMISSPVHKYNENFEKTELLGSVDVVSAKEVVVELFDDAKFTNGDPITGEDVKFTFEQIKRGGEAGAYPGAAPVPYDTIEADGKTCTFKFTEPYIPFANTTLMRWGVLHKKSFEEAGAIEDPGGAQFDTPIVTSGPLRVTELDRGQRVVTEPAETHPTYEAAQPITFQAYRNEETIITALEGGEVDIAPEISPPNAKRVNEEISNAKAEFAGTHTSYNLQYVCHTAPCKFTEFRKAVAAVMDRKQMIGVAMNGQVDPDMYPTYISHNHPYYPPEDMLYKQADDPTGSPDKATSLLEDAGWGFDGDGNLHYPPDADLDPLWPQGEGPSPEEFPCMEELGLES
ncbi:MAG: ABC transporter substrate-binding protein [Haloferacaceae archaeon]